MQCSITKTAVAVVRCADKLLAVCMSVKKNGVLPNNLEEIQGEIQNLPEGMVGICNFRVPMTSEWLYPHELEFYKALNAA